MKSSETFCTIGPHVTPRSEDPQTLRSAVGERRDQAELQQPKTWRTDRALYRGVSSLYTTSRAKSLRPALITRLDAFQAATGRAEVRARQAQVNVKDDSSARGAVTRAGASERKEEGQRRRR